MATKSPKKKRTSNAPRTRGASNLDALYDDWDAFMPRDAKASKLEVTFVMPTGPLKCSLRFGFYCYIDTPRYGYVGDTLRDAVKSIVKGEHGFPAHPDAVFDPASLKIKSLATGYARADVKAKLDAILTKAFPPR
jgi:hypothetical protein